MIALLFSYPLFTGNIIIVVFTLAIKSNFKDNRRSVGSYLLIGLAVLNFLLVILGFMNLPFIVAIEIYYPNMVLLLIQLIVSIILLIKNWKYHQQIGYKLLIWMSVAIIFTFVFMSMLMNLVNSMP